jgi:hypothetical protein
MSPSVKSLSCALAGGVALFLGCGSSHTGGGTSGTSIAAPSSQTTTTATTPTDPTTDPHIAAALEAINASRATLELPPLHLSVGLCNCALRHAQDCSGCAGGNPQNFTSCAHADFKSGDTCGASAENQGVGTGLSEDQDFQTLHNEMMAEGPPPPGQNNHYANIMNPSYTTVGIGLFFDSNQVLWLSEEFE